MHDRLSSGVEIPMEKSEKQNCYTDRYSNGDRKSHKSDRCVFAKFTETKKWKRVFHNQKLESIVGIVCIFWKKPGAAGLIIKTELERFRDKKPPDLQVWRRFWYLFVLFIKLPRKLI